ncbi:SsgA family sporulation/cell division regulator [Streptomyces canus]|uniref:SsgA family sporulation/cell division regulator n=1 Tax=Streptomyces canus TaxID=58343 RepID=UPI00340A41BE
MSSNQPGRQTRPASYACPELMLDVQRVLDVATRQTIGAEFRFDPAAPLAMSLELVVKDDPRALWGIGRDLLRRGSVRPAASATSRCGRRVPRRGHRVASAGFEGHGGSLRTAVPAPEEWLEHTYELVPAGRELAEVGWYATAADLLADS